MNEKTETKADLWPWIRFIILVASVVTTWLAGNRKDPIIIPAPPLEQQSRVIYIQSSGGCQCATIEKK